MANKKIPLRKCVGCNAMKVAIPDEVYDNLEKEMSTLA